MYKETIYHKYDPYITKELLRARDYWLEKAEFVYTDKFVTAKELMKLYPCFTQSWLSSYGCYLYRTRAEIWDDKDNCQNTICGYSLNYIKKKIEQGYIDCNDRTFYFNEDCTELKRRYLW